MGLILTVQKKVEINASGEGWLQNDTVLPDPLVRGMWYFATAGTYNQIGLTLPEGKVYIIAYDGYTWDYGDLLGLISWNVLLNKPTSKEALGISELATLTEVSKLINDALKGLNIPTMATPDWNASIGQAGFIANKPTIPASPVNADWFATSGLAKILNKPTKASDLGISDLITAQNISSYQKTPDWNSKTGPTQILNKPTTLNGYGITDTFTMDETLEQINLQTTIFEDVFYFQGGQQTEFDLKLECTQVMPGCYIENYGSIFQEGQFQIIDSTKCKLLIDLEDGKDFWLHLFYKAKI